jgi:hypothetical protein
VRIKIREMLEERLAGQRTAILWPLKPGEIPDEALSFLVAYLPLEFGSKPGHTKESEAEYLEKRASNPRKFRNGTGLAVRSEDQIEILRRAVRYLLLSSFYRVDSGWRQAAQPNGCAQGSKLRGRESIERAAAESALLKVYTSNLAATGRNRRYCPRQSGRRRPATPADPGRKQARADPPEEDGVADYRSATCFGSLKPNKLVELLKLGRPGDSTRLGIRIADVVSGLYSFLGFPRLASGAALRRIVTDGASSSTRHARARGWTTSIRSIA